jgi:hypothetical protein
MSLRINTNMSALNALRNVERASDGFGRSIEKLASGLRINRGADDPAGLIRSEDLRAQIVGLEQAIANSQDATNLIKTAEGALDEMHNLLRSMRQLAVASGNTGTNDQTALQANQNQIQSAIDSINRIAAQTQFGTKKAARRYGGHIRCRDRLHSAWAGCSSAALCSGASAARRPKTTRLAQVPLPSMSPQPQRALSNGKPNLQAPTRRLSRPPRLS